MRIKLLKIFYLSLGLMICSLGHSAVITADAAVKTAELAKHPSVAASGTLKGSLIEKALLQRQADKSLQQSEIDLKMLTSIRAAPTQNFFAAQNQRFSRFMQFFFAQQTS